MIPTSHLHSLIHKLTQAEKRYFKVNSVPTDKKSVVYYTLFKAIEAQKVYDEAALKKKLENVIKAKDFANVKKYLTDTILSSLEAFHTSVKSKLRSLLNQCELLETKGELALAIHLVKKGKKLALKYEYHRYLCEFLTLEISLLFDGNSSKEKRKDLEILFSELHKSWESFNFANTVWEKKIQMISLFQEHGKYVWEEAQLTGLDQLYTYFENAENDVRNTFYARADIHLCKCAIAVARGQDEIQLRELQKQLDLFEKNEHQQKQKLDRYVGLVYNIATVAIPLGKKEKAITAASKLKEFVKTHKHFTLAIYLSTIIENQLLLKMAVDTTKIQKIQALQEAIEAIPQSQRILEYDIVVSGQWCLNYFILSEFKKCNRLCNRVTSLSKGTTGMYWYTVTKTLQLISHFEQSNFDSLDHLLDSRERDKKKQERASKVEMAIVSFLKKLVGTTNKKLQIQACKELLSEIIELKTQEAEKAIIQSLFIEEWLISRITNSSFREEVRKTLAWKST